jgi:hypothetical protein
MQQPDLIALLLGLLVAARGEEGQVLAVRAPARIALVVGRRVTRISALPSQRAIQMSESLVSFSTSIAVTV